VTIEATVLEDRENVVVERDLRFISGERGSCSAANERGYDGASAFEANPSHRPISLSG